MKKLSVLLGTLFLIEIMGAAIVGPYSCQWGNGFYLILGVVCLIACGSIMLLQRHWQMSARIGYFLLSCLGSVIVWIIGFLLGDFRIVCKLF